MGDDDVGAMATLDGLQTYNCDIVNFAAFHFLSSILGAVPGVFMLIQGGSQWASQLRDNETHKLPTAAEAVDQLINSIEALSVTDRVSEAVDETIEACKKQLEHVLKSQIDAKEPLLPDSTEYRMEDEPKARAGWDKNLEKAATKIKAALKVGLRELKRCGGREKLEETLQSLRIKDRYSLRAPFEELPATTPGLCAFLGVPADRPNMFSYTTLLRGQYKAVKEAWKARPAAALPYTPRQVMDFWIEVAKTSPELGELAQLWWEKPISSAGVERIFSILTHMDDEHRRQMQDETLYNTLFFACEPKACGAAGCRACCGRAWFPRCW